MQPSPNGSIVKYSGKGWRLNGPLSMSTSASRVCLLAGGVEKAKSRFRRWLASRAPRS